ncbi:hypothetical protein [Micromonospora haikouensis]|uniref:hypothetical protein n=1 Tax=Micromonospora haikouensis TaxID=686309 RepID=UPI003D749D6B
MTSDVNIVTWEYIDGWGGSSCGPGRRAVRSVQARSRRPPHRPDGNTGGTGDYRYTWQPLTPFTGLYADQGPASSGYCSAYADVIVRVTVASGTETASADVRFPCF